MLLSTTLRRSLELALLLFIPNVLGAPIPATLSNLEGTTETGNVTVSIFHINDIHGHLDGFTPVECCEDGSERCLGGYARIQHTMKQARSELNNSLFFNCGDEYQGTSFFRDWTGGEIIAETINELGFDAMVPGNHEFDRGDDDLAKFLTTLGFPILAANIESIHPVLNSTLQPFKIFPEYGLAVIGVTTNTVADSSNPGENTTFSNPIIAMQDTIDFVKRTTDIKKFAAITHIGYEEDQKMAAATKGLYLIMGGHSHTPLGDPDIVPGTVGPYPTLVKNSEGENVYIVQSYRWGEVLGSMNVTWNEEGKIVQFEGRPIHITNELLEDEVISNQTQSWRHQFETSEAVVVGETMSIMDEDICKDAECTIGNMMTDALLAASPNSDIAFLNSRGIRSPINAGNITRGEIQESFPFENRVVKFKMSGLEIWKMIEGSLSRENQYTGKEIFSSLQVSAGTTIKYNKAADNGQKLISVQIAGGALNLVKIYEVVTLEFLAHGKDNIVFPAREREEVASVCLDVDVEGACLNEKDTLIDVDILEKYLEPSLKLPLNLRVEGRIVGSKGGGGRWLT